MPVRINPNYCVSCTKWEWDEELVVCGVYFYHQRCLDKLNAGLVSSADDAKMFRQLRKAFGRITAKK